MTYKTQNSAGDALTPLPSGEGLREGHDGEATLPQPLPRREGSRGAALTRFAVALASLALFMSAPRVLAEVRVQDITHLQGQRENKLMGYGLVVGLPGTGDGEKYAPTMRALMALHGRYHQPIVEASELKGNNSVAIVTVEAAIPEFGARDGETVDVVVSSVGPAKSLRGGQLLMTPLQSVQLNPDAPDTWTIFAWAGGALQLPDSTIPTRAVIKGGATIDRDVFYFFVEDGAITLVLDDAHAGWTWAHMVARAINHELTSPEQTLGGGVSRTTIVADADPAEVIGPQNVRVQIPAEDLPDPASFIARVQQTRLFMLPAQKARVTISRTTKQVSFTGSVTVSPTVLQIPGLGTVLIGQQPKDGPSAGKLQEVNAVEFSELLKTLSGVQTTPDQLIGAIEQLHESGSLHAELRYE